MTDQVEPAYVAMGSKRKRPNKFETSYKRPGSVRVTVEDRNLM